MEYYQQSINIKPTELWSGMLLTCLIFNNFKLLKLCQVFAIRITFFKFNLGENKVLA